MANDIFGPAIIGPGDDDYGRAPAEIESIRKGGEALRDALANPPHADTDTGADVTARALAGVAAALSGLSPEASSYLLRKISPALDIAAAAVRLTADPAWWQGESVMGRLTCVGCFEYGNELHCHAPDCRAMALDAAIRAAGEAGT